MKAFSSFLALIVCSSAIGQERIALTDSQMPSEPPAEALAIVNAFPGVTFNQPLGLATPPGETNRLFVLEKGGDVEVVSDLSNPSRSRFLNLDALVNARNNEAFLTSSEQGLLGMAFHPDYEQNGRFFVVYSVAVNRTRFQRLSEFTVSGAPNEANPSSERIFLQQRNDAGNHNGGDLHFGPDGYLYMSWGDEGQSNDTLNNSQQIDKDFWSSMIRIDVDLGDDDGNLPPNSHPAIVLENGEARYEVPADNPWVGADEFLGRSVDLSEVRTEFYAVGLRNPWRFSFDLDGTLWCGDVGQNAREEINQIVKGGNYEWAFREGFIQGAKWRQRPSGWSGAEEPIVDYRRSPNNGLNGTSVTGGVVYRGTAIPSLTGKYIFADFNSGHVWRLDGNQMVRIGGEGGIAGFGHDPSNGDLLMADLGGGVRRLVSQDTDQSFPQTLSQTGLFSDVADLIPSPGLEAYDINLPFWSDHALKQRWFGIPNTTDLIGYSQEGNWDLPEGMIWVKHFDLESERGNPETKVRIETRVIVRNDTGNYGVSYRWNEAGTEANLVDSKGESFEFESSVNGSLGSQTWTIPSRADCRTCHTDEAGHALSFRTRQLNRAGTIGGSSSNQLSYLALAGYLGNLNETPETLPRHVRPDEAEFTLEERARAYLDVNCSYCHFDGGTVPAQWDARSILNLFETGMVNGIAENGVEDAGDRLILPGQGQHSVIANRAAARNGYTRMPPLGSNVPDEEGVQLLDDWIEQELPARESYEDWYAARFGVSPPAGSRDLDPDGDQRSNFEEFLLGSDPTAVDRVASLALSTDQAEASITLPEISGRELILESSPDMVSWSPWVDSANNGLSRAAGQEANFRIPMTQAHEFFRLRVTER